MTDRYRFAARACQGLLLAVALGGCGGPVEQGLLSVKGRVTLDGGPWPAAGQITFVPVDDPKKFPSASVPFDTSGSFTVTGGAGGGAGLHPGTYRVSVRCIEGDTEMPLPGQEQKAKDVVPPKYQSPETSGLEVKVEDKSVDVNLDVKSK